MKNIAKTALLVLPALAIYSYLATTLNVVQDDAYISYRYVANFLNGDGLVFNIGERIEGFTNFAWVIYMTARSGQLIFADYDPYFTLFNFWTGEVAISGFIVLGTVLVLSLFVERPFCKYAATRDKK